MTYAHRNRDQHTADLCAGVDALDALHTELWHARNAGDSKALNDAIFRMAIEVGQMKYHRKWLAYYTDLADGLKPDRPR